MDLGKKTAIKPLAKCNQCGGTGKIFLRPNAKVRYIDCEICYGTGVVEMNMLWTIQGAMIHEWRVSNEITLRKCAKEYSIDPSNLSKMERGIIKPDTELLKLIMCGGKKI